MEDQASGKSKEQVIAGMLAENCEEFFIDWSEEGINESYYQYLTRTLTPYYEGQELKKQRRNHINSHFFSELRSQNPKLYERAQKLREKLVSSLKKTQEYHGLVPSFVKFIKEWDQSCRKSSCNCSLVIRTFGKDIEEVIRGFKQAISPKFEPTKAAISIDGQFHASSIEYSIISMNTFIGATNTPYLFVQDNYARWKKNGFQAAYGKPFPLSDDAISMFFDDNIEGAQEAAPVEILGNQL